MKSVSGYTLLEMMVVLLVLSFASLIHLRWEWQQLASIEALRDRDIAWQRAVDRLESMSGFATLTPQVDAGGADFQSLISGEAHEAGLDESWQVDASGPAHRGKHLAVHVRWPGAGPAQSIDLERHLAAVGRAWQ
jgi:prepilin-type N-terminal cleavage/methylation domain